MSFELTSVNQLYTEAINAIKIIKMSNQRLLSGGNSEQEIPIFEQNKAKVEKWIKQINSEYLDPQTSIRL